MVAPFPAAVEVEQPGTAAVEQVHYTVVERPVDMMETLVAAEVGELALQPG